MNKGRRRRKRKCRRMFSRSEGKTGATENICTTVRMWYRNKNCLIILLPETSEEQIVSFRISMVWVHNGCAWERTSQEEGDLQVGKNLFQGPSHFVLTSLPQIRGAMDSIQHELVGEAGQEVQIGSWLLCRGVQQQGPGGQVGLGHSLLVDQLRHSSTFNVISSAWTKTLQSSPPSPPSTTPTPPPRSCGSLTARSTTNPLW